MFSDWDLVCSRAGLVATFQAVFWMGFAVGVPITGVLGDMYGRRMVLLGSYPLLLADFTAMYFAPNIWVAIVSRCIFGAIQGGFWKAIYVVQMEVTDPKHRNWIGLVSWWDCLRFRLLHSQNLESGSFPFISLKTPTSCHPNPTSPSNADPIHPWIHP